VSDQLTNAERARVAAIHEAWRLLTRGDDLRPVEVTDLVAVAHWLHTGEDPWPTMPQPPTNPDQATWTASDREDTP
jgi:hypothetical protein